MASPPVDPVQNNDRLPPAADVVVIGGGIAGASAAYYLAKRGVSVALVEKGLIGCEQSSRNWGWVRQTGRDRPELPLIREALRLWGELGAEIGDDLGFRRTGILYVTKNPADVARWERWAGHAREHQIHSRLLTGEEARALIPGSTVRWIGGMHTPSDGRAEPSMAAPALARAAQKLGVSVHQNCAARGLETTGGRVSTVVTERGAIRTQSVLCAGGVWSTLFCRRHGIDLPQAGVRGSALRTGPAPDVFAGNLGTPGFTMRRRVDGGYTIAMRNRGRIDLTVDSLRYARAFWPTYKQRWQHAKVRVGSAFFQSLTRSESWALDQPSPFEAVRVIDPEPDGAILRSGIAALKAAFPAMKDVTVSHSWSGLIDHLPDQIPVISAVDTLPGFYLSTGYSGHGFGIGPGAGRLAADIITGARPLVDPTAFRYARLIDGTRLVPELDL
jgi:glycine/D-amino acid oxidase-like deaminating enzyme